MNKRDGCKETLEGGWRTEGPINVLQQRQIHTLDQLRSLTPTHRNTLVRSQLSLCLRLSPSLSLCVSHTQSHLVRHVRTFPTDCCITEAEQ